MSLALAEDAPGDVRNAQFLAVAADLAYFPEAEGVAGFRDRLGLTARMIAGGNTQAYVATSDDAVVVAFRGTESPDSLEGVKDWLLTDALNLLVLPDGRFGTDLSAAGVGARFHRGFCAALESVWDAVYAAVKAELDVSDRPLWITGHSLGGALALLSAWLFQRKFVPVHAVVTFGAPMIGNLTVAQAYERELAGKVFRYNCCDDPVPLLPTMSLLANDYGHCPRAVTLGAAAAGDFLKDLAGRVADGVLSATLLDEIWSHVKGRVDAHLMTNYLALIDSERQKGAGAS